MFQPDDSSGFWEDRLRHHWEDKGRPDRPYNTLIERHIRNRLKSFLWRRQKQASGQTLWATRLLMSCNVDADLNLITFCESTKYRLFLCRVFTTVADWFQCELHELYPEACELLRHNGNANNAVGMEVVRAARERFVTTWWATWWATPASALDGLRFPYEVSKEQLTAWEEIVSEAGGLVMALEYQASEALKSEKKESNNLSNNTSECLQAEEYLTEALIQLNVFDSGSMHLQADQGCQLDKRRNARDLQKDHSRYHQPRPDQEGVLGPR